MNIAQTEKIKQGSDDSDVAVIVSDMRKKMNDVDHGSYHVVDCVIHPRIVGKAELDPGFRDELIAMCFDCVKDVQKVDIDRKSGYEVITATYMKVCARF